MIAPQAACGMFLGIDVGTGGTRALVINEGWTQIRTGATALNLVETCDRRKMQ
jgi:sugar (pentulose or hexulose) kinase